ncbi:MAG: hypothetical protein DWG76_02545 [Chloroflexi bacterium]|nr:hypothetical protein [Chloroflexota bacterium]
MSDRRRAVLGFVFLALAMGLAVVALIGGSIGWDFKTGVILSVGTFVVLAGFSAYLFISIRNYAWFPAVVGGLYAVLPDLVAGPADDAGVLLLGAALSGLLSWRRKRKVERDAQKPELLN